MSKTIYQTVYGVRVYPIDYLINNELTETDLSHLFDTPSLKYSIIIGMFRYLGKKKRNSDIVKMITKNNNWINNNEWTEDQFKSYENKYWFGSG